MAKLTVGKKSETFPLPVEIPTPAGLADVEFTARNLDESEWDELRDAHTLTIEAQVKALFDARQKAAEAAYSAQAKKSRGKQSAELEEAEKEAAIAKHLKAVPQAAISKIKRKLNAELMARLFTAWDLEDKFGVAALEQMCNSYPAAAEATFTAFDKKLRGARLGN